MSNPANARLTGEFVVEAQEHLTAIEPDLLRLETGGADCEAEVVNRIFRAMHSIKGGAGLLGFERINRLSHAMEALVMRFRDRELVPDGLTIDLLLAGVDSLQAMLADIHSSQDFPCDDLISQLDAFLGVRTEPFREEVPELEVPSPFSADDLAAAREKAAGQPLCWVRLELAGVSGGEPLEPLPILAEMASMGAIVAGRLEPADLRDLSNCLEARPLLHLLYAPMMEPEHVAPILEIPPPWVREPVCAAAASPASFPAGEDPLPAGPSSAVPELEPSPLPPESTPPVPQQAATAEAPPSASETIRVRVELLTNLMNLASELVLSRNQLLRTLEEEKDGIQGLSPVLQNLNLVTSFLQEQIMQTRMQPVGTVFAKIPRLVRSISQKTGKRIEVEISGAEVELDKSLIEALSDPITHLIRNCCDHGLEAPADRQQAAKPEAGVIRIRAFHEGGLVNIAISDDGRGIDPVKVVEKALTKGLLPREAIEGLSPQEQLQLIFQPGLSTAESISDISGRGVGMDVVRNNIEKLGGHVELESLAGHGTTVVLKLPLTLAIIPCLIARVADQRFAIPQVSLIELVRVSRADFRSRLEQVGETRVLRLRDGLLPLVGLGEILRLPARDTEKEINILVLRAGPHRYGLMVDEVFQVVEIVVKPLSGYLKTIKTFAGATIMDDGRVAMILDAMGIAVQARLRFGEFSPEAVPVLELADSAAESREVLLFTFHPEETFALSLASVARLEPLDFAQIRRIGSRELLDHRGTVLSLVRLDEHLPVRSLPAEQTQGYLIIPKQGAGKTGLLASEILDTVRADVSLDRESFPAYGAAGSAVVDGRVTVFLDLEELLSEDTTGRDLAWEAII